MFRLLRICIDKLPLSANGTWRLHTSLTAGMPTHTILPDSILSIQSIEITSKVPGFQMYVR